MKLGDEILILFCKLLESNVGIFVRATQLVPINFKFCSNTKFVAGTIQETEMFVFEQARVNCGVGVQYEE